MNKNSFDWLRLSVNIQIARHIFFLACPISNKSDKIKRKRETLRSRNPFANGPLHFIQGDDQGHTRQVLAAHCRMHWTSTSKWGPSVAAVAADRVWTEQLEQQGEQGTWPARHAEAINSSCFFQLFLTDVACRCPSPIEIICIDIATTQTGKTVERQHSKLKLYSLDNENLLDGDILFLERQLLHYAIFSLHVLSPFFKRIEIVLANKKKRINDWRCAYFPPFQKKVAQRNSSVVNSLVPTLPNWSWEKARPFPAPFQRETLPISKKVRLRARRPWASGRRKQENQKGNAPCGRTLYTFQCSNNSSSFVQCQWTWSSSFSLFFFIFFFCCAFVYVFQVSLVVLPFGAISSFK